MNAELKKLVDEYVEKKGQIHSNHPEGRLAFQVGMLQSIVGHCLEIMDEKQVNYAIGHIIREMKK